MAGDGAGSPGAPASSPERTSTPSDSSMSPRMTAERPSFYEPKPEEDNSNEQRRRPTQNEEVPLDFSIRKHDSDDEDDADSNASAERSLSPPPLLKRDQVSVDFSNYKPGPTVFPHMNNASLNFSPPMPKTDSCVSPRQAVKKEKIGEPQTASPGMIPGVTMSAAAQMHGLLPGFPPGGFLSQSGLLNAALPFLHLDPRAANAAAQLAFKQQQQNQGKNGSTPRPFKTYPKDPLSLPLGVYNMPEMPPGVSPADVAAANAMSANSEQLFSHYKHMVRQMHGDLSPGSRRSNQQKAVKERRSSDGSTSSQVSSTSAHSEQGSPAIPSHAPGGFSSPGDLMQDPQSPSPKSSGGSRKRPRTIPEELKDIAYWERRRKNNEAAKRSRDARRAKEDEIAIRAAFLEQENLKLRVEVAALKNETSKLRCMLYNS